MDETEYCLKTEDDLGNKVVFSEKQRRKKAKSHPELRDDKFINGRLKTAINHPHFVYGDVAKNNFHCYYIREFHFDTSRGKGWQYTKVIVLVIVKPYQIITAFRPQIIKEEGRTKCLRKNI